MRKKNTPSTIDRLPKEVRAFIGKLRDSGRTIDEILAKLAELDVEVSRSALGRHIKTLADSQQMIQRSRDIAEALVREFGEEPDDKVARLNVELAHGLLMRIMLAMEEDPETGEVKPMTFSPQDSMFIAKALQSVVGASKTTDDKVEKRIERARKEEREKAADNATKAARAKGLSKDTVDAIRHAVLGSDT